MNYQKFVIMFLFLSVQAYSMQIDLAEKRRECIDLSLEDKISQNYQYNKLFFQKEILFDLQPCFMSNLDHRSNIQFIRTSKHLYEKYVQKTSDEIKYNDCLFTTIPFDFNCYTRAMFHYAPQNYHFTQRLLAIEDIGGRRASMLTVFGIDNVFDIVDFYQQRFSDEQITKLANDLVLFKDMLKKGLCCHNTGQVLRFFRFIMYRSSSDQKDLRDECFSHLLRYSSFDPNARDDNGTILKQASDVSWIKTMKVLLYSPAIHRNTIKDACDSAVSRKNIEEIKVLLPFIDGEKDGAELINLCRIHKSYEVLKMILDCPKIDPNKKNINGLRPLYLAAALSDIELVKILLADKRVDPGIGGPFSTAYAAAKDPVIKVLLSERTPFYKKYPFTCLIMAFFLAKIMWDCSIRFI